MMAKSIPVRSPAELPFCLDAFGSVAAAGSASAAELRHATPCSERDCKAIEEFFAQEAYRT